MPGITERVARDPPKLLTQKAVAAVQAQIRICASAATGEQLNMNITGTLSTAARGIAVLIAAPFCLLFIWALTPSDLEELAKEERSDEGAR